MKINLKILVSKRLVVWLQISLITGCTITSTILPCVWIVSIEITARTERAKMMSIETTTSYRLNFTLPRLWVKMWSHCKRKYKTLMFLQNNQNLKTLKDKGDKLLFFTQIKTHQGHQWGQFIKSYLGPREMGFLAQHFRHGHGAPQYI